MKTPTKAPTAAEIGSKGGKNRFKGTTKKYRIALAKKAAEARWGKK